MRLTQSNVYGDSMMTREVSGFRLKETLYPPKTKVPPHSHEEALFCIALKGICNEVYAGKTREYETFSVEFLPQHQSHSLTFSRAGLRAFSVEIAPRWLEHVREYSLILDDSVYCQGGLLSRLFMKLYKEFRQTDDASLLAIEGLTLELLADASRRQVKVSDRTPPGWLSQALELLLEQFSERLTIAQVAGAVGVHPVHLSREFHKFYRCTIGERVRQLRIEQACRELCATDEPLAAIASGAGFSDQSHFSRTFKSLTSMTPAEYRATFAAH